MPDSPTGLKASVGFHSNTGPRAQNDDFAGSVFGTDLPYPRGDVVAVIADGMGGTKGGRVAAETAVRGFLDGFCDLPETMEVQRAGGNIISSLNNWIYSQGRQDNKLEGMGCTFTALVLRGRIAHVLHVGDTRAYRLRNERLICLTTDHSRKDASGRASLLTRALGVEAEVRLDYASQPMTLHDRFLLCSDGVHGFLSDAAIADILSKRSAPGDTSRALVDAALKNGGTDNTTAMVLDVVQLPTRESGDLDGAIAGLPIVSVPILGQTVDGFLLKALLSDGRYSRLYAGTDEVEGGDVAIKFPKPQAAPDTTYRTAYVREALVGELVNSPSVGRVIELPPGRQTCLYTVMPLYEGELLETRLSRRPAIGLEEGRNITIKLARATAALHRVGIIHRDIKPDNVILESDGALKLIDLGVVRIPGLEDFPPEDIPGTPAYMAPEMFADEPGNEATDIYALGVTMFRAFTGAFAYGNIDATSQPRNERPTELTMLRPDLPAWLQSVINKAIARNPGARFRDMIEFAVEMEAGPSRTPASPRRPLTLYEKAPVRFWQAATLVLAIALAASLYFRH